MTTLSEVIERWERDGFRTQAGCAADLRALLTEAQGQGIVEAVREAIRKWLREESTCSAPACERCRGGLDAAIASVLLAHGIQVGQPASKVEKLEAPYNE